VRLTEADAVVTLRSLHSLVDSDRQTIGEIASGLPVGWPVDGIVLYGSKARGDGTPDSDIDLLVLTRRPLTLEELGRMRQFVRSVGLRLGMWPELNIRTSDEWWNGVYQASPIRKEIDAEGIAVFRFASRGRE
jgi:predicted nucleotidyltransferase